MTIDLDIYTGLFTLIGILVIPGIALLLQGKGK